MNQDYYLERIAAKQDRCIELLKDSTKQRDEYIKTIKLSAANEVRARDLQIKSVSRVRNEEAKKTRNSAIATGIFAIGLIATTLSSGLDVSTVIENGAQALKSIESLGSFCMMIPTAIYATLAGTVVNIASFIKHRRKYCKVSLEYSDLYNSDPVKYLDDIYTDYYHLAEKQRREEKRK